MQGRNTPKYGVRRSTPTVICGCSLSDWGRFAFCSCIAVIIRIVTIDPPKPIVVRVDEVGRAEAVAYEAMEAQADPLDPTTKYFLNRFIHDFYSRRRATVQQNWSRSLDGFSPPTWPTPPFA